MRILEQSEDVLTLQNPATDFWLGNICLLISGLLFMVLFAASSGWWFSLLSLLSAIGFLSALINIWTSNVVKVCSFNKALSKVTVKYYGLQAKIKDLPLQNVRAVEVRKVTGYAFGAILENAQLWLLTENVGAIPLSEGYDSVTSSDAIANQVREFLSLRSRSI